MYRKNRFGYNLLMSDDESRAHASSLIPSALETLDAVRNRASKCYESLPVDLDELLCSLRKQLELIQELQEKTVQQVQQLNNDYLRAEADRQNEYAEYELRIAQAKDKECTRVVMHLIGIFNMFQAGMQHDSNSTEFVKGMQMIYKLFEDSLERLRVKKIGAVGEAFDSTRHRAVGSRASEEAPGTVLDVTVPGYSLNDKVIVYAEVIISSAEEIKS